MIIYSSALSQREIHNEVIIILPSFGKQTSHKWWGKRGGWNNWKRLFAYVVQKLTFIKPSLLRRLWERFIFGRNALKFIIRPGSRWLSTKGPNKFRSFMKEKRFHSILTRFNYFVLISRLFSIYCFPFFSILLNSSSHKYFAKTMTSYSSFQASEVEEVEH